MIPGTDEEMRVVEDEEDEEEEEEEGEERSKAIGVPSILNQSTPRPKS